MAAHVTAGPIEADKAWLDHVVEYRRRIRCLSCSGVMFSIGHGGCRLPVELVSMTLIDALACQVTPRNKQRILGTGSFELRLISVALRVSLVVTAHTQCRGLDEVWPVAAADVGQHVGHCVGDRSHVIPSDLPERHPVADSPGGYRYRVLVLGTGKLRKAIVLADESDGQVPQGGQVECFMECACGDRPVAEEGDHDVATATSAKRVRGADRDRQARADDAVSAEDPKSGIRDVHRPSAALARAGGLAHQLSENASGL